MKKQTIIATFIFLTLNYLANLKNTPKLAKKILKQITTNKTKHKLQNLNTHKLKQEHTHKI